MNAIPVFLTRGKSDVDRKEHVAFSRTIQPMKSSASVLPLLLTALAGTSPAFTAQSVRHAQLTGRSMRLCASQERQRDEHLDGPHQDINISDVLGRERYMRAVECSKTDNLCDAAEMEELHSGECRGGCDEGGCPVDRPKASVS